MTQAAKSTVRYFDVAAQKAAAKTEFDLRGPTGWLAGETDRVRKFSEAGIGPNGLPMLRSNSSVPLSEAERAWISKEWAGELAKGYLGAVGKMAFDFVSMNMPRGFDVTRSDDRRLLDLPDKNIAHLGYCEFARFAYDKADGTKAVIRVYYANFVGTIDTTPGAQFFTPNSIARANRFFALAFKADEDGKLEIDRELHHGGVSFLTHDHNQALDYVIEMRTGVKAEVWRRTAALKRAGRKDQAERELRQALESTRRK